MKFNKYILDKYIEILILFLAGITIVMMLFAFDVPHQAIICFGLIYIFSYLAVICFDYWKRRRFYNRLISHVEKLDKKYLVLEMLYEPSFYDGKLFYQILYEINKSMIEHVKDLEISLEEFKEYIELWIHEIKLPISSLTLMNHNHKNEIDKRYAEQIKRINDYVDQILYYVRSEYAEKDYLIKEMSLKKVIHNVALKNKNDLLENHISFIVDGDDKMVLTDSKWMEFIINQIVSNSIKYKRNNVDSIIKISIEEKNNNTLLHIYDNGIGISSQDIHRVFDKTFTGENGRTQAKSTGMGLYIAKKLCMKLGHKIDIQSVLNEYTDVTIMFSNHDFYKIKD